MSKKDVPHYARTHYSRSELAHQQMLKHRAGPVPDKRKETARRAARTNTAGRYRTP